MDGSVVLEDRLSVQQDVGATDLTVMRSATPSAASSSAPLPDGEMLEDAEDEGTSSGFPMCGSSFAMGVVAEPNRSPTPMMMGAGNGESPESSVGAVDDDSFAGGHSPQPSSATMAGAATQLRRSVGGGGGGGSNAANAPALPADMDVLNDEIGDLLKAAVLTTIDDLRRRKARPNLKNIGHMMLRRHGCSPRQVEALLEFLVERDIVIKVDYKGQASYRNASKWKKGHILKGTIMNPAHISRMVIDVVVDLEHRLNSQTGVHPDDVELVVLAKAAQHQVPMNKQKFNEAIAREIDLGRLQKLKNGYIKTNESAAGSNNQQQNIISPLSIQRGPPSMVLPTSGRGNSSGLTPNKHSPNMPNQRKTSPQNNANFGSEPSVKRPKMTPSSASDYSSSGFPQLSTAQNLMSAAHSSASPGLQKLTSSCRVCSLTLGGPGPSVAARGSHGQDMTLMCATCRFSVHASCADYSIEQAIRYRETGWMCPSCRTCTYCGFGPSTVPGDGMQLIVCDQCDRSYHMTCHIPQLMNAPLKGARWLCSACDLQPLSMSRFARPTNNLTTAQQPANSNSSVPQSKTNQNRASLSSNGTTARSVGDVTPPLTNSGGNHRNGAASRTTIGGLPTPSGSGESTDEQDISGAQFMPTGPVPPIPSGLSDRIADWTIADVATYFRSAGYNDQARLVQDQEIDGAALLLLKRDDIIHELGFKLGPALKIYQIVAALQRKSVLASSCHQPGENVDNGAGADLLVG